MARVRLVRGDCRESMRDLYDEGLRVDSVVTDTPYALESITRRFCKAVAAPAKFGSDGAFARASAGFMGAQWDVGDVVFSVETWKLVFDLLLPGGYVVAFSSARTGHRMATAIEDAGFVIHPMIGWAYGQGMPKPHAADKGLDRALGLQGGVVESGPPVRRLRPGADQNRTGSWEKLEDRFYQPGEYVAATALSGHWSGRVYGGQARKPALEPIYVAQKPFSERNGVLNMLRWGVGAVDINSVRPNRSNEDRSDYYISGDEPSERSKSVYSKLDRVPYEPHPKGRHPANLIHDSSPEVLAQFPEEAKRFFERYDHDECEESSAVDPFEERLFYHKKADKIDRMGFNHATVKPVKLMEALVRHVTPYRGTVLDLFAGTGTTGLAAARQGFNAILLEKEESFADMIVKRCQDYMRD